MLSRHLVRKSSTDEMRVCQEQSANPEASRIRPAQRLAGLVGFAEIARADAKFFDRGCGEGIGKQGAQTDHPQRSCTKRAISDAKNIKARIQ